MLNIKLGLSAIGLELSAWGAGLLQQGHSDTALLSYLLLHGAASVLLSLSLLPLLPPRLTRPRWAALALMVACSYAIPLAGFGGVLAAFVVLRLYRGQHSAVVFETLQTPEFDQHQKRHSALRQVGLRSFLGNHQAPLHTRLRAMASLQHVPGRTASPLLREVLSDPSEDLRLLAYGMLDNLEKRLNRSIDQELDALQAAQSLGQPEALQASAQRLSDLYWELVYQELVQGDLRQHALQESLRYCQQVLQAQPLNAPLLLRQGRLQHALGAQAQARASYQRAQALGLPATRVLPYQAELCFAERDFAQVRLLLQELGQWNALPRLRPVLNYWKQP